MEFLTAWYRRDFPEVGKHLYERKVNWIGEKEVLQRALHHLKAKKNKNQQDKHRIKNLEAQIDRLDKFEKWGI
jgi:hypothetical protein